MPFSGAFFVLKWCILKIFLQIFLLKTYTYYKYKKTIYRCLFFLIKIFYSANLYIQAYTYTVFSMIKTNANAE